MRLAAPLSIALVVVVVSCVSGVPHPSIEAANVHYAAEQGHLDALQAEIQGEPALVLTRAADGTTLVHDAAKNGRIEVLAYLVELGAPLDAQDRRGRTPLHDAASHGRDTAVSWLLEHGAKADIRDARGETPLVLAVLECAIPNTFRPATPTQRLAIVAALLQAGADFSALGHDGRSLREIAAPDSQLVALLASVDPSGGEAARAQGSPGDSSSLAPALATPSGPEPRMAPVGGGAGASGPGSGDGAQGGGGEAEAAGTEELLGERTGDGVPPGEARAGLDTSAAHPGRE